MKYNIKKALIGALFFSAAAVVACGNTNTASSSSSELTSSASSSVESQSSSSSSKVEVFYTFTFDSKGGSAVEAQSVKEGEHATCPEDPTKSGFVFDGWYKETECTNVYDFDTETVTADTTVYANWLQESADADGYKATFYYNYEGAPNNGVYQEKTFVEGAKLRKPSADPTRDGYSFGGWYMEATCETPFANNTVYTGNQSIYASWLKTYVFEAEDTQLTGFEPEADYSVNGQGNKIGHGNSNDFSGTGLIGNDPSASNGKAVHGIYYKGAYLDFELNCDKATTGATLALRLAAEFRVVTLSQTTFQVKVNNKAIAYKTGEITMDGSEAGDGYWDTAKAHNYSDYVINSIDLKEGANLIRLYVNNDNGLTVGTCGAMAPIVDCVKITTASALTMTKYENK